MRQSRFIEAQIIGMIKEQEAGMPTTEVCRRHGLSPASFYKFKLLTVFLKIRCFTQAV
jgi:putative transposase